MGVETMLTWTFSSKVDEVPNDVKMMLLEDEVIEAAYKTIRDIAIFTDKRLIIRDAQGFTGTKIETYTIPYSSINMYSSENSGNFLDFNSEIELWTRAGHFKINLKKGVNIREIDKVIAKCILK